MVELDFGLVLWDGEEYVWIVVFWGRDFFCGCYGFVFGGDIFFYGWCLVCGNYGYGFVRWYYYFFCYVG